MSETRSAKPLSKHREPFFYSSDGLVKVECRCGWKGYFDRGDDSEDWVNHLFDESVVEYESNPDLFWTAPSEDGE